MTLRYFKCCALIALLFTFSFTSAFAGPLHNAAKRGDITQIKRLLDSGIDVNTKSGFMRLAPLHYAAMKGRKEGVELLLSRGADPNLKGLGWTPLHFAIYYGHQKRKEIVELLLSKGADVNIKGGFGRTPLHGAAIRGRKEIVELLLSKGANPNAKDNSIETPLHWAAKRGQKEIVKLLLYGGADPNIRDKKGRTPLYYATRSDQEEIVELLKNYPKIKAELLLKKKRIKDQETLKSNLLVKTEEKKGDQAKKAGQHKKALSHYIAVLKLTPPGTDMDLRLRKKIISFVRSMRPRLPFPAEARRHAIRGQAFLRRAKDKEGYRRVLTEFQKAVQLAPWWASGYFNLALIQEKVDDFNGAIGNLKLYLIANPRARDAAAVEKKIIDLEVAGELKGK